MPSKHVEIGCVLRQVSKLFASDDLNIQGEQDMFEAMLSWINHSKEQRKVHVAKLFSLIRLTHMPKEVTMI